MFRTSCCATSALAVSLALFADPAQAEDSVDGSFETITVTATRSPIQVSEAPATVSVIDAVTIADNLVTDLRDLVRFEPGISVRRAPARFGAALASTGRGGNEDITVRGIGGNRVLIQVDGVRVPNGFSFGAQSVGRGDYVDIGLIKSVEILRGPASALYGSDGLSGAVSFTTSDPDDLLDRNEGFGGLIRAQYASADEEFAETAILAGRAGNWSAIAAYTRRDHGELDSKGENAGTGAQRTLPNPQDGASNAALARIVFAPAGGHRFRLTGEYLDNRLSTNVLSGLGPTGFGPTVVDRLTARDTGKRRRLSFDWFWQGSGIVEEARAAIYWQDASDRQFTVEDRTPSADRTRINTFDNRVYGVSADARRSFATGNIRHRLAFGGDISWTRQRGLRDGTVPTPPDVFPTRAFPVTDFTLAGVFLGDEIEIGNGAVTIFPALRLDHYKLSPTDDPLLPGFVEARQDGTRLSPKLGLVAKSAANVRLYANYAQGFRAPEPSQVNQFFENPNAPFFAYRTLTNPDLKPETSRSIEGGIRYLGKHVKIDVSVFRGDYRRFISQEQVGGTGSIADPILFQFINLDRVSVDGFEVRGEYRAAGGITADLTVSYADGDVRRGDRRTSLSTVDPLKLVAGIGYRDPDGRFGGEIIATHSARQSLSDTVGVCTTDCLRPAAFTILDATAFARLGALTVRAGVFNITDKKYAWWSDVRGLSATTTVADAFTQPGRNVSVSATYTF
jgi:hemoglobin/transferrin/lactoferrin receptor protein